MTMTTPSFFEHLFAAGVAAVVIGVLLHFFGVTGEGSLEIVLAGVVFMCPWLVVWLYNRYWV